MADSSDNIRNGMTPQKYAEAIRGHVIRLNDLMDAAHAEGLHVMILTVYKQTVGKEEDIPHLNVFISQRI